MSRNAKIAVISGLLSFSIIVALGWGAWKLNQPPHWSDRVTEELKLIAPYPETVELTKGRLLETDSGKLGFVLVRQKQSNGEFAVTEYSVVARKDGTFSVSCNPFEVMEVRRIYNELMKLGSSQP